MPDNDDPRVIFSAHDEIEDMAAPDGVCFSFDPDVLEDLMGPEYAEDVVKTWTKAGTLECVTDDFAREVAAGRTPFQRCKRRLRRSSRYLSSPTRPERTPVVRSAT